MTIDEAIAHLKYDLEIKRSLTCNYSFERQLVGWLEELKAMRNLDKTNFSDGYNKAIDDFVNYANTMPAVKDEDDGYIRPMHLEEMAEKLRI